MTAVFERLRVTPRLVSLVCDPGGLNDEWRDLAERAFADTVGVLLAGATEPAVAVLAGTIDEFGGPVRAVATGAAMSARSAALLDGTAAHALDYDDVDDALIAHPSAVLVPALLAAGQAPDVTGEDLLDAFRVGLEAARALAAALGITEHYVLGWHSTGTIGTIAAAAAAARLARLGTDATGHALGIAGSLAAGSRQNFGTMTKPLHAGAAAANGLLAARLAAAGFTADPDQLDGPLGFRTLHAPTHDTDTAPPSEPAPAGPPGLNVKLFPCCYATHSAAEAALDLAREISDPAEVTAVEVVVPPGGLAPLVHHRPVDGAQAKFCMEYVVAVCLLDRSLTLASFEDDRVRRADVQSLIRLVEVSTTDTASTGSVPDVGSFAVVTVFTVDGRRLSSRVDRPVGHASRPLSEVQLKSKFLDCVRGAPVTEAERAYDALRGLRRQGSIARLVENLGPLSTARGVPR